MLDKYGRRMKPYCITYMNTLDDERRYSYITGDEALAREIAQKVEEGYTIISVKVEKATW